MKQLFAGLVLFLFLSMVNLSPAYGEEAIQIPASAWLNVGLTAEEAEDHWVAIAAFGQAILQDEQLALAYGNRCVAYIHVAEHDLAIADCAQAIALEPQRGEFYLNRGVAEFRQGKFQ
ncbi:MAG: hypothetical protein AAF651_05785, partial [Cyanobacteria bacterium P01_C01_bin.73]